MKTFRHIFIGLVLLSLLPHGALAQIPVTDAANLAANQVAHAANIAKWIESIAQLKTQIDQLNQQISLQTDLRTWTGNPAVAGNNLTLGTLTTPALVRDYGRAPEMVVGLVNSLQSLGNTSQGTFRALDGTDLDGNAMVRDALTYRRYSVLDAMQGNSAQVAQDTRTREKELQTDIAGTLEQLKAAPTEAEAQKLAAKLTALNGQLGQVEAVRRREVDAVTLQKIANDARSEEERQAAAELEAKDDYLANQRVSTYMKTLKVRQNYDETQ